MVYNGIDTRHYRRLSASGYTTFLVFFLGVLCVPQIRCYELQQYMSVLFRGAVLFVLRIRWFA